MKKIACLILLIVAVAMISACNRAGEEPDSYETANGELESYYPASNLGGELNLPLPQRTPQLSLIAGWGSSMLLTEDGELWIWGHIYGGTDWCTWCQTDSAKHLEEPIMLMDDVVYAVQAARNIKVIRRDGSLWGLGCNAMGQLGDGTTIDRHYPIKIMDDVVAVSIGSGTRPHAIRSDGSLWSWGGVDWRAHYGSVPMQYDNMENIVDVAVGNGFTLALKSDGSLWSWGGNFFGQLGDGTNKSRLEPAKIMENVIAISAGDTRAAAIKADGSLWTWGFGHTFPNYRTSEYWTGSDYRSLPVKIMDDAIAISIGGGSFGHFMAIKSDNSLWGWGWNMWGQLGNSTYLFFHRMSGDSTQLGERMQEYWSVREFQERGFEYWGDEILIEPLPIKIMEAVRSISTLNNHTLIVTLDSKLLAFGGNHAGQLGDGATVNSSIPKVITILDDILNK